MYVVPLIDNTLQNKINYKVERLEVLFPNTVLSFSWLLPHFRVNVTFTQCYYIPHYWVHNTVQY